MRFPLKIRRRKTEVTIYGRTEAYAFYRAGWRAGGKPFFKSFGRFKDARTFAEGKARELAQGGLAATLSAREAEECRAALNRLAEFNRDTGKKVTLPAAIEQFCAAAMQLNGCTITEAAERYASTLATVKRKDVGEGVEEFIKDHKEKTKAKDGKRPEISVGYAYTVSLWLREFARTFPATAICDLTKDHLNAYVEAHAEAAPKTRNERRNVVRRFLNWCRLKDYLYREHRLFEAARMKNEKADDEAIEFYSPADLRLLLEGADKTLLPILALTALAGVRLQEAMRLTWQEVFKIAGQVEISSAKSKTRSRRVVTICSALEQWLAPYRERTGPLWSNHRDTYFAQFNDLLARVKVPPRRNGLRHAFVTFHFATHQNENLTAAEAGNSPAMIHRAYKGLTTKTEAEKWFAVVPPESAKNVIPLTATSREEAR